MKKFLKILLATDVLLLNLLTGYFIYDNFFRHPAKLNKEENGSLETSDVDLTNECGQECFSYIDSKIEEFSIPQSVEVSPEITPTLAQTKAKFRKASYVPVPGSGSTNQSSSWVDLATTQFYLDLADFPNFVEAYFEANIRLVNGNGEALVRLYDATHNIAVVGSEVKTSNQATTVVISDKLNLWSGRNVYKVQARSLTADTTVFDSGRIKIISEE